MSVSAFETDTSKIIVDREKIKIARLLPVVKPGTRRVETGLHIKNLCDLTISKENRLVRPIPAASSEAFRPHEDRRFSLRPKGFYPFETAKNL
jgi:hypothetical protein